MRHRRCRPVTGPCSSARCCAGSSATAPRSGWRRPRAGDCRGSRPTAAAGSGADLLRVRAPLRARRRRGPRPDAANAYRVLLDDRPVWPPADSPYPPVGDPHPGGRRRDQPVSLIFGSCREATPHATGRELPPDALDAYARRLMAARRPPTCARPDRAARRPGLRRRDLGEVQRLAEAAPRAPATDAPGRPGGDFDEYTKLYLESWRDPEIRWLLSTVPSVMIFDDHEIIDDWNTSASWRADMAGSAWWDERIPAGLASYWVYQHLGNLAPGRAGRRPALPEGAVAADDATERAARLRPRRPTPSRRATGVPVELRPRPRPDPPGHARQPLQPGARPRAAGRCCRRPSGPGSSTRPTATTTTWWSARRCPGCCRRRIHHLEAWNERLADSPGPGSPGSAEKLRRALDLEHWAAFGRSFDALGELFRRLGEGVGRAGTGSARRGVPGAGLDQRALRRRAPLVRGPGRVRRPGGATPVHQLTCSPVHNQVPASMRPVMRFGWSRAGGRGVRGLARSPAYASPPGALEDAGRPVLRQRGEHAAPHRAAGRGADRGHHQRRAPARGGPAELSSAK